MDSFYHLEMDYLKLLILVCKRAADLDLICEIDNTCFVVQIHLHLELEIIQMDKDYQILDPNLQPFFWRKVKNIIR